MRYAKSLLIFSIIFLIGSFAAVSRAVVVTTAQQLSAAIEDANNGGDPNVQAADGIYTLDDMLWVSADGVSVEGLSGNRDGVIIQGHGMDGDVTHIFNVQGSHFRARHLTLGRVSQHAVQFQPEADAPLLDDLHIVDTGQQMVKIAYYPDKPSVSVDNGILQNSILEYSAGIGPRSYIGGIDAHNAGDWVVRDNIFRYIRSPSESPAEHAVHEWLYLDGRHIDEQLFYLVSEKGRHQIGGLAVEAGSLSSSHLVADGWKRVRFSDGFSAVPAVFAHCDTAEGRDPVLVRIDRVDGEGFDIAMEEEEAKHDGHLTESIGWIAIENGSIELAGNRSLQTFSATVNDKAVTTNFTTTFTGRFPVLLARVTTSNEGDPCLLRYRHLNAASVQLFVQEETSADRETTHDNENVSLMVVSP